VQVRLHLIDSLEKIVETKKNLDRLININRNLFEHLIGSTIQLLRYGEKYNVIIPKKEQLESILKNTQILLQDQKDAIGTFNLQNNRFNDSDQPSGNTDKSNLEGNST